MTEQKKNKFALILFNNGGGGHLSAANAVKFSLENQGYQVEITEILKDIFQTEKVSKTGEARFDYYFRKEKWFALKILISMRLLVELLLLFFKKKSSKKRIRDHCKDRDLDLLISVFPIGNALYQKVSSELNVPFVIVPTDIKTDHFFSLMKHEKKNNRVFAALPCDEPKMIKALKKKNFSVEITDYPIRNDYELLAKKLRDKVFERECLREMKESYGLRSDDKSILISIGAKGFGTENYIEYINLIDKNIEKFVGDNEVFHLFSATGSSKELFDSLNALKEKFDSKIKMHVLPRLDAIEMAQHMKMVDAVISKPGGGMVAESMANSVPLILQSDSSKWLPWERANMEYVRTNNFGVILASKKNGKISEKDYINKLMKVLSPTFTNSVDYCPPQNNFSKNFIDLVSNI